MGVLVEQTIPTLFGGVSRQPPSVRFPNQCEDAENVVFSVETGGFSKRPGTWMLASVDDASQGPYRLHGINRDADEKYLVVHRRGSVRVFDALSGTERTVLVKTEDADFFDVDPSDLRFMTALDYTFVVDVNRTVRMLPPSETSEVVRSSIQVTRGNLDGVYSLTVTYDGGSFEASYDADPQDEADDVATGLFDALQVARPVDAGWSFHRKGSFIGIRNVAGVDFTLTTEDPHGDLAFVTTVKRVKKESDLVARSWKNHVVEVRDSSSAEGYFLKFETDDGSIYGNGIWLETVPPGVETEFDPATMPRALVRRSDGDFELQRIEWNAKVAGGEEVVPRPDFVDHTISDMTFHRNRMGLVSGETIYFSRAGDYFHFWPETATDVLDTDPFGLSSSTPEMSKFDFVVNFRKSLFVLADMAQFEVEGETFTPTTASINLATSYQTSTACRPVVVGDELYFISDNGEFAHLMSYVYQEATVSETAHDVSKHVAGMIPNPVVEIVALPVSQELMLLSGVDRSKLFVHRFYYSRDQRVQSSWSTFRFPGATIHGMTAIRGEVFLLIERGGAVFLETLRTEETRDDLFAWTPHLDRRVLVDPIYDPASDETAIPLPYDASGVDVVTTMAWPETRRMLRLVVTRSEGRTAYVSGRWDDAGLVVGATFPSHVELSKLFYREAEEAVISGRVQVRSIAFRYSKSGSFVVEVEPFQREPRRFPYSGRILGSILNKVQAFTVKDGVFRARVGSRGDQTTIRIRNDDLLPMTITSAVWTGFFNETTRQDRA